jgi:hypothetical protein
MMPSTERAIRPKRVSEPPRSGIVNQMQPASRPGAWRTDAAGTDAFVGHAGIRRRTAMGRERSAVRWRSDEHALWWQGRRSGCLVCFAIGRIRPIPLLCRLVEDRLLTAVNPFGVHPTKFLENSFSVFACGDFRPRFCGKKNFPEIVPA